METVVQVLLSVARELAQRAKAAMPKLREGEKIRREWFSDGVYCRETVFAGEIFLSRYDFRKAELVESREKASA